jgi:hypothetical protein
VARHRAWRRSVVGSAAAVLAIVGVLATVPSTVAGLAPAPVVRPEPAAGPRGDASPYDLPVRGSLAGDEEFLTGMRAVDWGDPADRGSGPLPPGDTRRVVYAADVASGQRWALVLGWAGGQLVHAWFTGPAGASPDRLELAGRPAPTGTQPLALLDAATGMLVVVGRPGDGATYSPSLDRDDTGRLERTFTAVPVVDGVPAGEVPVPVAPGSARVRMVPGSGGGSTGDVVLPSVVDEPPSPALGSDADRGDPRYWLRLRDCLVPQGFEVVLDPAGTGLEWSGGPALAPDVGQLSSAEQARNTAAFDRCVVQAGRG